MVKYRIIMYGPTDYQVLMKYRIWPFWTKAEIPYSTFVRSFKTEEAARDWIEWRKSNGDKDYKVVAENNG